MLLLYHITCIISHLLMNEWMNKWMNEFLEQLVRDLTNAFSRSQKMFGERVSPGPANQRSFPGLPCCWGQLLIKHISRSICLIMLCLSPYQRVFYALASWCPSQRTRDNSKRRGLIACVQSTRHKRQTSEPKSS